MPATTRTAMLRTPPTAWLLIASCLLAGRAFAAEVSFIKEIAPVLVKHCQQCHGAKEAKGKFRVDTFELMMKGGASGEPAVTAGKPQSSELYNLLVTKDAQERMPKKADALPAEVIAKVKMWIEQGGRFDGADAKAALVDLIPPVEHPPAPQAYPRAMPITALAFSPDGQTLFAGGYHEITVWSAGDGRLIRRIGNIAARTYALAFSPDGKTLAVAGGAPGEMGEVRLINPQDGKLIQVLFSSSDVVFDVQFSGDGKLLAACGADQAIRVFDMPGGKLRQTITGHTDWVTAIAFNADATQLASASRDKSAKVYDLTQSGAMIGNYLDHNEPVYGVAFGLDKETVISGGRDRRVMQWKIADGKRTGEVGVGGEVFKIVPVEEFLYVCLSDNSVRQVSAKDRQQKRSFGGQKDWVYCAAVHPAVKRIAGGGHSGEVRVWNLEDGATVTSFVAAPGLPGAPGAAGASATTP